MPLGTPAPTVGRIVHYALERDGKPDAIRPAIVTQVWSDAIVNLTVLLDGPNDQQPSEYSQPPLAWKGSVHYDEGLSPNTWSWPPRA